MTDILKKARAILAERYCPFNTRLPDGRVCAMGALDEVMGVYSSGYHDVMKCLAESARVLHPELKGQKGERPFEPRDPDYFDVSPVVFVNNHVGKKAILEVFDLAILEREAALEAHKILEAEYALF